MTEDHVKPQTHLQAKERASEEINLVDTLISDF